MATRAQRDAEKRRRQAAGQDYSDAAITAAIGALDSGSSYSDSGDSGSTSCDTGSGGGGDCG